MRTARQATRSLSSSSRLNFSSVQGQRSSTTRAANDSGERIVGVAHVPDLSGGRFGLLDRARLGQAPRRSGAFSSESVTSSRGIAAAWPNFLAMRISDV
jgi:hypothetical protein